MASSGKAFSSRHMTELVDTSHITDATRLQNIRSHIQEIRAEMKRRGMVIDSGVYVYAESDVDVQEEIVTKKRKTES